MVDLGDKNKKYKIQVYMRATATICAGNIYCDTKEEYEKILNENIDDLYDEGHFNVNCHNNFDIGDAEYDEFDFDENKDYCENK